MTRLLSSASSDIERLRSLRGVDPKDDERLDAVKYRFVTVIEGCVGIAHHIVVSEGWVVPETNADAIRELGARGVIDGELADSLARAVGFRNVLVHQYAAVDDEKVVIYLDRLDELDAFVAAVARWLNQP